jgi:hypothetical protein
MAARNLVLVMMLATGAFACAREAKTPEAEQLQAERDANRERAQVMQPRDPPPAVPPPLTSQGTGGEVGGGQVAGIGDNPAPIAPAPGPAEVVKDEDARTGPTAAQLQDEARANAQAAAKEKAKWEKQAHDADRRQTEDWSRDRVMKAAARAAELQNQSSRVPPAKRGRFNTDMTTFQSKKSEVLSRINSLSATGTDEWKVTKRELDRAIDQMDAALIRLEGDF